MPIFKSWRDNYNGDDVEAFLKEQKLDEDWAHDAIAGDGDLLLAFKMDYAVVSLTDLQKLNEVFKPKSLTIEALADMKPGYAYPVPRLTVTLSWNN